MFKHILLPTDGSSFSEAAVEQGIVLAKTLGAKVAGLCAMPLHYKYRYTAQIMHEAFGTSTKPDTEMEEAYKAMVEDGAEKGKKLAKGYLSKIEKRAGKSRVACEVLCEENDFPYEAIIRVAERKNCDLIIMASHGRSGVKGLLLGSETQKVLTHSKIPVLVCRSADKTQKGASVFNHILLPTDGSELSAAAIRQGVRFAKSIGAKVTGLCVIPEQDPFFYQKRIPKQALEEAEQRRRELAKTYLEAVAKGAMEAGVVYDVVFENNDSPYEAIIQVAEREGCDLIMMASHGRRGVGALLLGSETQKVLTHSRVPVLVFR